MLQTKYTIGLRGLVENFLRNQKSYCSGILTGFRQPSLQSSQEKQFRVLSSQASKVKKPKSTLTTDDWEPAYRFKYILAARGMYLHGLLDEETTAVVVGGTAFTCGVLYFLGNTISRIVAIIYTSPSKVEEIKISRLTFWGNRLDTIHRIDDFTPLGDLDYKPTDIYFRLKMYSDYSDIMYLSCRYGTILNLNEFERVFGLIPEDVKINVRGKETKDKV